MAKPKEERNRLFQADWQKGMRNEALAEKYGSSVGGVKALKARLRRKLKESSQVTSPSTSTSTKRMTFWLPGEMIEKIKAKAAQERRTSLAILREILEKNL